MALSLLPRAKVIGTFISGLVVGIVTTIFVATVLPHSSISRLYQAIAPTADEDDDAEERQHASDGKHDERTNRPADNDNQQSLLVDHDEAQDPQLASRQEEAPHEDIAAAEGEVPDDAPEDCPGLESDNAGKSEACAGCPNQQICASGEAKKEDPAVSEVRQKLASVKHKLLVLSGKGGVGKSTVSSQLSWTLQQRGFDVGLLDIDICGPSIAKMTGCDGQGVHPSADGWSPVYVADNFGVMSVAFLLPSADDAVIWRGPKKNGLIKQFLTDVTWGELDFLIIDTPPGTSDEHLSIVTYLKQAGIDGAVVVTTPQEIALADVRKEINFCKKTEIGVIGVVENMTGSVFQPTTGGATTMCEKMDVPFMGRLSLQRELIAACEKGRSVLADSPDSVSARELNALVDDLLKKMELPSAAHAKLPADTAGTDGGVYRVGSAAERPLSAEGKEMAEALGESVCSDIPRATNTAAPEAPAVVERQEGAKDETSGQGQTEDHLKSSADSLESEADASRADPTAGADRLPVNFKEKTRGSSTSSSGGPPTGHLTADDLQAEVATAIIAEEGKETRAPADQFESPLEASGTFSSPAAPLSDPKNEDALEEESATKASVTGTDLENGEEEEASIGGAAVGRSRSKKGSSGTEGKSGSKKSSKKSSGRR